ncbi:MAG: LPP20 family lipoprotein [Gammaproteobacteria bacterium]|nr:LPP20 family lipoprotein [Gammaproteobacteria bacterium]
MPNKSYYSIVFSNASRLVLLMLILAGLVGCNWYIPYSDEYGDIGSLAQGGMIEATGYSVIQSHSGSEPQQRLMAIKAARLDAFRQLAEVVYGAYIDSNTTVSDLTIQDDVFRARVEGVIYGAELIKIEPISNDTYAATLGLPRAVIDDLRLLYMRLVSSN